MVFSFSRWRVFATVVVLALLPVCLGCKKKHHDDAVPAGDVTISGNITYLRYKLAKNTDGVPTGLEKTPTKMPARGILIRAFQLRKELDDAGQSIDVWALPDTDTSSAQTYTDANGAYSLTVPAGVKTIVEVASSFRADSTSGAITNVVRLFSEPVEDPTPEPNRHLYFLRKGADGVSKSDDAFYASAPTVNTILNFDIGEKDNWWTAPLSVDAGDITPDLKSSYQLETHETGSRIPAIFDSIYSFAIIFGDPTPGGNSFDLSYQRGHSDVSGTFADLDFQNYPTKHPKAWDGGSYHYFGTISGASTNDDAFDEGVLFRLLGRCRMAKQFTGTLTANLVLSSQSPADSKYLTDRQDLSPDLALLEGLGDAMAASLLQSPYLADTDGIPGGGLDPTHGYRDIRDLTGFKRDLFSAPNLSAMAWDLVLKANSIASPGTPTTWANISSTALLRFFTLTSIPTSTVTVNSTSVSIAADIRNIYGQITRLQESQSSTESVDLSSIFTDATLTPQLKPFNIPWPRPTGTIHPYSTFLNYLGTFPSSGNSTITESMTFSMEYARENAQNTFPNVSFGVDNPLNPSLVKGEIYTVQFGLTQDMRYNLSVASTLPSGAAIQLILHDPNGSVDRTYEFDSTLPKYQVYLSGATPTSPVFYKIQARLVNPGSVLQDIPATITFTPVN